MCLTGPARENRKPHETKEQKTEDDLNQDYNSEELI